MPKFITKLFLCLIVLIIVLLIAIAQPVMAIEWNEFSKSLNQAFSEKDILNTENILSFILFILILLAIAFIINYENKRTNLNKRQSYHKIRQEFIKRRQLSNSSNNRAWFRMPTQLPFHWVRLPVPPHLKPDTYFEGLILDISGGGMLFHTKEQLKIKDEIKLWITIDGKPLELNAQVVRIEEKKENESKIYVVGAKFINIRDGQRDRIIGWIMKSQIDEIVKKKEIASTEDIPLENSKKQEPDDQKISSGSDSEQKLTFGNLNKGDKIKISIESAYPQQENLTGIILNKTIDNTGNKIVIIRLNNEEIEKIQY